MDGRIESVVSTLQEEEQALLSRKSELDQQSKEIEVALKRVHGALSALGERGASKTGRKNATSKPSPDKNTVRDAVCATLGNSVLEADDLKTAVGERLGELGYSRVGLSLRLKEVLSEDAFAESPDGYRMLPPEQVA